VEVMSLRYTFRLKPERDSDLIDWLNSLGEGERSCFIRQALRKALRQKGEMLFRYNEKENLNAKQLPDSFPLSNNISNQNKDTDSNAISIESKLDQLTNAF
jgi:hypothetical protein